MTTKKTYILDTNVLLSDSNSLFGFAEHDLVIPLIVLEELDRHKDRQDEVGRNARDFVRKLHVLTKDVKDFKVGFPRGPRLGTLKILSVEDVCFASSRHLVPLELREKKSGDNTIVEFCKNYAATYDEEKVVLVTRDTILRLKAHAIGIDCEDYKKFNVATSANALYSGVLTLDAHPDISIAEFYANSEYVLPPNVEADLFPNQFVVIKEGQQSAMARFLAPGKPLKRLSELPKSKIKPRNKEQELAMELLYDDNVKLVTMTGKAGTGKNVVSLDAGLEQVLNSKDRKYHSLVICRPIMPVGKDLGFLPGDLNEKLEPWLAPIKDNLRFLLADKHSNSSSESSRKDSKKASQAGNSHGFLHSEQVLQSYFDNGVIEVQPLTYIRGRSIANAFVIVDEAQNTNLHEIKTILTRVGENTKIVLIGDVEQMDRFDLDSTNNGLAIIVERFKQQSIAGHVSLIKGERSELATVASNLL
jgi:PhoH-like ATPase